VRSRAPKPQKRKNPHKTLNAVNKMG
jgi:hypothetical protein